jgi:hypothetical protein
VWLDPTPLSSPPSPVTASIGPPFVLPFPLPLYTSFPIGNLHRTTQGTLEWMGCLAGTLGRASTMDRWIEGCPQIRIKNIFVSSVEREKHTWHRFPLGVSSHSVFVFLHEPRRLADDTFSNRQSSLTLVRKCRTARTGCSNPRLSGTRGGSRFSTSLIGLQNFGTWRSSPGTTTASLTMSDPPIMGTVTTARGRGRTGCPTTLSSSSLDLISPPLKLVLGDRLSIGICWSIGTDLTSRASLHATTRTTAERGLLVGISSPTACLLPVSVTAEVPLP